MYNYYIDCKKRKEQEEELKKAERINTFKEKRKSITNLIRNDYKAFRQVWEKSNQLPVGCILS